MTHFFDFRLELNLGLDSAIPKHKSLCFAEFVLLNSSCPVTLCPYVLPLLLKHYHPGSTIHRASSQEWCFLDIELYLIGAGHFICVHINTNTLFFNLTLQMQGKKRNTNWGLILSEGTEHHFDKFVLF